MGRELKRVPLDFDYPLNEIWKGYVPSEAKDKVVEWKNWDISDSVCSACEKQGNECYESAPYCIYNPEIEAIWHYNPPEGEGYQMWETTTEGSPQSPVFKTLDELCEWCEDNTTAFASFKATKEEWKKMFDDGLVMHRTEKYLEKGEK